MEVVKCGKTSLRFLSMEESLEVSRAVDALLARRSEMHIEGSPSALVLGELAVRIRCEPPYLLPHVRIRPSGALGKRVNPLSPLLTPLGVEEQRRNLEEETTVKWGGMASSRT